MRSRRKQLFPDVESLEEVVHKLRDELQTPQQPRVSSCPDVEVKDQCRGKLTRDLHSANPRSALHVMSANQNCT